MTSLARMLARTPPIACAHGSWPRCTTSNRLLRVHTPDDTFVFTARLLSNNQPVGRSQGACTATAGNASECRGTLFLKDGKIFILGGTVFNSKTTLGIVGGTGPYIGSRGTLTTTKRKSGDLLEVKLLP